MRVRKGDNIVVLTGKDKGKKAKVLSVLKNGKVLVENVNMVNKRRRARKAGEKGQTVQIATPIDVSNVALWCNSCGRGVRVGVRQDGAKKVRICVKCKANI